MKIQSVQNETHSFVLISKRGEDHAAPYTVKSAEGRQKSDRWLEACAFPFRLSPSLSLPPPLSPSPLSHPLPPPSPLLLLRSRPGGGMPRLFCHPVEGAESGVGNLNPGKIRIKERRNQSTNIEIKRLR